MGFQNFWQNLPMHVKQNSIRNSIKSVKDKIRTIMNDRRSFVSFMSHKSGVDEETTPIDDLLDDFLQEIEDINLSKHRKAEENNQREIKLVAAGELNQRKALDINRCRDIVTRKWTEKIPYEQHDSENVAPVKIPRYDKGTEQWNDSIEQHMTYPVAKERSKLELRREELELER